MYTFIFSYSFIFLCCYVICSKYINTAHKSTAIKDKSSLAYFSGSTDAEDRKYVFQKSIY